MIKHAPRRCQCRCCASTATRRSCVPSQRSRHHYPPCLESSQPVPHHTTPRRFAASDFSEKGCCLTLEAQAARPEARACGHQDSPGSVCCPERSSWAYLTQPPAIRSQGLRPWQCEQSGVHFLERRPRLRVLRPATLRNFRHAVQLRLQLRRRPSLSTARAILTPGMPL